MMKKLRIILSVVMALSLLSAWGVQEDDLLTEDSFEGTLGNWRVENGAGLYTWPGSGYNYASTGSGAGRIPRTCGSPALVLTEALLLDTQAYTNLTITFDYDSTGGGGTVRWTLQYSDNFGTNWTQVVQFSGSMATPASYTNTLNEGAYNFTDQAIFRITGGCQTPTHQFYVDEMTIVGFPKPPPKGTVITLY